MTTPLSLTILLEGKKHSNPKLNTRMEIEPIKRSELVSITV